MPTELVCGGEKETLELNRHDSQLDPGAIKATAITGLSPGCASH
jgi:hypothetical protein